MTAVGGPSPTTLVFVYGTLKRGFPNHPLLSRAEAVGPARSREPHPMAVAGRFFVPVLLRRPGEGHRVRGELYRVDPATLAALDVLEGVDDADGYERAPLDVEQPDGRVVTAQVYFKREPVGTLHTGWLEDYRDDRYVERDAREG